MADTGTEIFTGGFFSAPAKPPVSKALSVFTAGAFGKHVEAPAAVGCMDPLALFTQGQFLCFDNEDPELLLFTHGEFPCPVVVAVGGVGAAPGVGNAKRRVRRYKVPEIVYASDEEEAILLSLLLDDDDDWW